MPPRSATLVARPHKTLKEVGLTLTTPLTVEYDRRSVRVGWLQFALLQAVGQRGTVTAEAARVAAWGSKEVTDNQLAVAVYRLNAALEKVRCPARVGQFRGNLLLTF